LANEYRGLPYRRGARFLSLPLFLFPLLFLVFFPSSSYLLDSISLDVKLGELVLSFETLKTIQNGIQFFPLWLEEEFAGELQVTVMNLNNEPRLPAVLFIPPYRYTYRW